MKITLRPTRPLLMLLITWLVLGWFALAWCLKFNWQAVKEPETYVFNCLMGVMLSAPALVWNRLRLQASIISVLIVWLEANLLYSYQFFSPIPASAYHLASNGAQYADAIWGLIHKGPLIGFIILMAAAWVVALKRPGSKARFSRNTLKVWGLSVGVLSVAASILIMVQGGIREVWVAHSDYNTHHARPVMFTLPGWLALDSYMKSANPSATELAMVGDWLREHDNRQGTAPAVERVPKSVVMITVESLESWPIGLSVEGKEITPCLNRFMADTARRVFYAPKIASQTGIGRSIDAQLLANIGLLPGASSVWAFDHLENQFHPLTLLLKGQRGAKVIQATAATRENWNQGPVYDRMGADKALFLSDWRMEEVISRSVVRPGDRAVARQLVERLENDDLWPAGQRAFLQFITLSSHSPWTLPPELDQLHLKQSYPAPLGEYLTAINYTDQAIGLLLNYIYSRPDSAEIMTVIFGDHEGIGADRERLHAEYPYVSGENLVPLIVINGPAAGQFSHYAGEVDIYPTLLDMLALTPPEGWHGLGFSLLRPGHPHAAVDFKGTLYGSPDPATEAHLRQAWGVSDLILKHNLLAPQTQ